MSHNSGVSFEVFFFMTGRRFKSPLGIYKFTHHEEPEELEVELTGLCSGRQAWKI